MEPNLYITDNSAILNGISGHTRYAIMTFILNGKPNIVHHDDDVFIIDENGIKLISKRSISNNKFNEHRVHYSIGWLDFWSVLNQVDESVTVCLIPIARNNLWNREYFPLSNEFTKLSLIIQILMTYSDCRDINRLLLRTFFDKNHFGKTYSIHTIINNKWQTCFSFFCGYFKTIIIPQFHNNVIMKLCNMMSNHIYNKYEIIDGVTIQILYNWGHYSLIMSKSGHNSFMVYNDGYFEYRYLEIHKSIDQYIINMLCDDSEFIKDGLSVNGGTHQKLLNYVIYDIWTGNQIVLQEKNIIKCLTEYDGW